MLRFYLALWASKIYLNINKLLGNGRSDRAGLLAAKICPNVLDKLNKPKLVIAVTGTNGKSTVTNLLNSIFVSENKKVGFNDWNANALAGHIRCLIDSVNFFNNPNKDIALLEVDEVTANDTIPYIRPDYLIVTNISRDSVRRNSYPEYVFNQMNLALDNCPNTKLILNADDPISSFLGNHNEKVFISVDKFLEEEPYDNIAKDFTVCPKCNKEIKYLYRHYRHIGRFVCPNCNFQSLEGNYVINKVDFKNKNLLINKKKYPLISNSIFNIYNELAVIVLLKELHYDDHYICNALSKVNIPKSREDLIICNDIKIHMQMAKGQNSSAASTVFELLSKDKTPKQIILLLDEVYSDDNTFETVGWLYDTDFEFLNDDSILKIIVSSHIYLDYQARLLLAGISSDRIICVDDVDKVYDYLDYEKGKDIYILYEVEERPLAANVRDKIQEIIRRNQL